MPIDESYQEVLKDLEARKKRCSEEIKMLEAMIANLQHFISQEHILPAWQKPGQQSLTNVRIAAAPPAVLASNPKQYCNMSVRWAILYLLAEYASEPMGRAEIAESLQAGGIASNAQSFASNVSAVLSVMAKERQEVEQVGSGGYQITAHGREVWDGIKRTPQWLTRSKPLAS